MIWAPVLLGIFCLIAIFLGPRIFGDFTLLAGDAHYYTDPTFETVGGDRFTTRPSNPLIDVDNSRFTYPARVYVQGSFARGEIPRWNPYLGMGVPFIGLSSGALDPVAALVGVFASPTTLTNLLCVVALLIAASGTIALLGLLGLSPTARIFGRWRLRSAAGPSSGSDDRASWSTYGCRGRFGPRSV